MAATDGILLGMGNPLLDISAEVPMSLLEKYELQPNNAILAEHKHLALYQELVANHKVVYVAGGAAQNSIRGAQWLLPAGATSYIGCVGDDHFARKLEEAAKDDGVNVRYMVTKEVPTGTCAVLITDKGANRSLVANLSAAEKYHVDHLLAQDNWKLVEKAQFFYLSSFFSTVSPASIMAVARHAAEHNKVFIQNLSAPFLCQFFQEPMDNALPYWDYIFGNESEAAAFAKAHNWETEDVAEIAVKLANMSKINTKRPRFVIFTQGADETIVAESGKQEASKLPIVKIDSSKIVDTNGAGDAFVAGFLSQLVQGKDVDTCCRAGAWTASIVIQQSGPVYPKNVEKPASF
ncbi:adenosine kinase [Sorochytrium milnesiophthora]